jgi:DNA replication and repair protein RecF
VSNAQRIHIRRLSLTDFRNYRSLRLDCDHRHVVLTGENGAGKTNLLEAVSLLTPGRGLRRATLEEMARSGCDGPWSVHALVEGAQGEASIGTGNAPAAEGETSRRIRINGASARSSEALLDHLRIAWLTPSMDGLFTGPASDRRKFLDRMVLAIDPAHASRVSAFERALRSRNRLLAERPDEGSWLDAVEEQIAQGGVAIFLARRELVSLIGALCTAAGGTVFPQPGLELASGFSEPAEDGAASMMEDAYCARLRTSRRLDMATGRTLEGPHRGDLLVTHAAKAMPASASSTGEQKGLLIALMLAHGRLVADLSGHAPVLLLDEIAAHLDSSRREALYERIEALGAQAWMTGTDRALFDGLQGRAMFVRVADGRAEPEA